MGEGAGSDSFKGSAGGGWKGQTVSAVRGDRKKVATKSTGNGKKLHCEQVSGNGWPAGH